MLIHVGADIPLASESMVQALREFAAFVRQHLIAGQEAEVSFAVSETGARASGVLAARLPADTKAFSVGRLPSSSPLTAAQFREAIARNKPKQTHAQVRLQAAAVPDLFPLLDDLAEGLPASGRGIMLLLHLTGWRFAGGGTATAVDACFSRFRHGGRDISATVGLRFHALSLKDPVIAATVADASTRTTLRFGKPMAAFPTSTDAAVPAGVNADPRLQPPTPEEQLIVLQTFDEAMGRAAEQIGARTEDLRSIPMLFSRIGGFHKRIQDVMAGKKESISLTAHLKRFMKTHFPEYRFDAADLEQAWFRKTLAPTLDLLLSFEKIYQSGLGKTFSLEIAVDFPNTTFGGIHTGWGGARKNIFWMFHEAWEKQVWSYTTSSELAEALAGCRELLGRVLPAVEEHCRRLLLPPPAALPPGMEQRGPLSARQAYDLALPLARAWAADAQLENVSSVNRISIGRPIGAVNSSITKEGRLRPHGSWGLKFVSRRHERYCYYLIPHTGRVWWNFYAVLKGAIPQYSAVLDADDDWLDSSVIGPQAFQVVQQQVGDFQVYDISLSLHDPKRYSGDFVWEAHCIAYGSSLSERRDVTVHMDRRTGAVVTSTTR